MTLFPGSADYAEIDSTAAGSRDMDGRSQLRRRLGHWSQTGPVIKEEH